MYQKEDEELKSLLVNPSLKLQKLTLKGSTASIFCDCSTVNIRPYVLSFFEKKFLMCMDFRILVVAQPVYLINTTKNMGHKN